MKFALASTGTSDCAIGRNSLSTREAKLLDNLLAKLNKDNFKASKDDLDVQDLFLEGKKKKKKKLNSLYFRSRFKT